MGWLFQCNTDTFRRNELHLPCSVSENYVILRACSWNITSKLTLVYNEKITLEVSHWLSFQGLTPFLSRGKLAKCTQFLTECCCPLIFACQSLIISLERIRFCISLLDLSLQKLIFLFHEKVSINNALYCGTGQ